MEPEGSTQHNFHVFFLCVSEPVQRSLKFYGNCATSNKNSNDITSNDNGRIALSFIISLLMRLCKAVQRAVKKYYTGCGLITLSSYLLYNFFFSKTTKENQVGFAKFI